MNSIPHLVANLYIKLNFFSLQYIVHIAVGLSNAVVITEDKQMIAWGSNQYGEFGSNHASILGSPTVVAKLDNFEGSAPAGICLGKIYMYKQSFE